jgi:hypothetical protein
MINLYQDVKLKIYIYLNEGYWLMPVNDSNSHYCIASPADSQYIVIIPADYNLLLSQYKLQFEFSTIGDLPNQSLITIVAYTYPGKSYQ